ncbi:MAG: hypothetical protein KAU47_01735 [Candidatus Aminicenantes bacterium]|nr:hypothetical protein [Candidatus Aminicenantes bacterium]
MRKAISIFLLIFVLILSPLLSQQKKLKVIDEKASLYLEPEKDSAVVEMIARGAILTVLSQEIIKDSWYYVSFRSEDQSITITGFVRASAVEVISEGQKERKGQKKGKKSKKTAQKVQIQETKEIVYDTPKKIQVILESANIRLEPKFESEIVHQMESGLTLLAVGKIGEWFRVNLPPDEDGIVISGFIHETLVREVREKAA